MNCRYCQKNIDTELVEHIMLAHSNLVTFYLFRAMPHDDKMKILNDVFPDFTRTLGA
jgi:hypothetical protein